MTKYQRQLTRHSLKTIGSMTIKSLSLLLILGLALVYAMGFVSTANAASLRAITTVDREHVTLGDLFDDVNNPNNIVGKAPRLGKEMVINSTTLKTIAKKHQVNWNPASDADQVIVRRASYTITADDIASEIKAKLASTSSSGDIQLSFNDPTISVTVPTSVAPTMDITSFNVSKNGDVFTATIAIPDKQNPVATKTIMGSITRTVSVPVLKTTMKKSDIITASDIDYINVPERALIANAVIDADDLIGMAPDRVITAGRVIKDSDVSSPQLVKRGDEILIQYDVNGLVLTAKGKASQNGAKGDFIRVINGTSAKAMTAEVTGDRTVMVR